MKTSKWLREARYLIDCERDIYLCIALNRLLGRSDEEASIRAWIRSMLGDSNTITAYVHERMKGYIGENKEIRLAWIDYLIDYCESIGD